MVRGQALRVEIVLANTTMAAVARKMGMQATTLSRKMQTGGFTIAEAESFCAALGLAKPRVLDLFFAEKGEGG